jgi:hypothetical protein
VQWFAVIVPFNAVLCRAEKASRHVPEPSCARAEGKLCTCAALRAAFCRYVPFFAVLCSGLPSSCRIMPSCAAPKKLPGVVCQSRHVPESCVCLGVCWRCDCVACLGSLGASAVAQHDARGIFAGSARSRRACRSPARRRCSSAAATRTGSGCPAGTQCRCGRRRRGTR